MLDLSVPWWEVILRGVVVYAFLLVLLRLSGKRQVGELAPFDLVLLLILSDAVQNSMNGGDNSLIGGLISAATLVGLNFLVATATFYSKKFEDIVEGRPQILIHHGKIDEKIVARAKLTRHELNSALRSAGCNKLSEVKVAILENTGAISIVKHEASANPLEANDEILDK